MDAKALRFLGTAFLLLHDESMVKFADAPDTESKSAPERKPLLPLSIKVLLADDSAVVRKAIARLLQDDPQIQLVAEAVNFRQTIELASELQPHVIVMDLHMGEEDLTPTQIKSSLAHSPILAICVWTDQESQALADKFGAVTLLSKENLAAELIPNIKRHVSRQRVS